MTRTSNWLLKTTFVLAAIATFLAVSFGETLATLVTVHQSTEDFYSTGGTRVSGCIGQGCHYGRLTKRCSRNNRSHLDRLLPRSSTTT